MTLDRLSPRKGCPFKYGRPEGVEEPGEGPQPPMLCHESGCLGGDGVDDYRCAGWAKHGGKT
jgi:hypothetical protein